jgi:hypothetical protein
LWQQGREAGGAFESERPLLEGVVPGRITAIRVDNIERGLQLRAERAEDGRWFLVDPIEYPAEVAVLEVLFDIVESQTAIVIEDPGELSRLSLDPPRAVVELEEQVGGDLRRHRLELGAVDLDQQYAYARVDGVVVKTLRSLDSTIERDLPGWRSRSIFHDLKPYSIVSVSRRGSALLLGQTEPLDVTLDAVEDDGWRATAPWDARLDPGFIGRTIQMTCYLRTRAFLDDAPADLGFYGLDPAEVTLQLECGDGRVETLRMSRSDNGEDWVAATESSPHIYLLSQEDVLVLTTPIDVMVDRELVRATRDRMASVRLEAGGRVTTLEQTRTGWTVSADGGAAEPADALRVEDVLSELERARVLELLPDVAWPAESAAASILIDFDGRLVGGRLGPPHETPDGGHGVLFRREGDGLVSLVEARLVELAGVDPEELRSLQLVRVKELDVVRIELSTERAERTYVRSAEGRWSRKGAEVEARAFAALVDGLLSVRALEHLGTDAPVPGEDAVQVRIFTAAGRPTVYELRAGADGTVFASGERQALVAADVHRGLVELMSD